VQHDLRDLAPVNTFGIRVEQAHIGHSVLSIIRGERGSEGARSATSGSRGVMAFSGLENGGGWALCDAGR